MSVQQLRFGELPYCSECGEARVAHGLNKLQFFMDAFFEKRLALAPLGQKIAHASLSYDRAVLPIVRFLARARLGTLLDHADEHDSIRTKALYDGAALAGVTLHHFRPFHVDDGVFIATRGDQRIIFTSMPRPRGFVSPSVDWMDDKGRLKPFLIAHDIPTAAGGVARTWDEARAIFERVGAPVIAKPHYGTRGRHTTIGILNEEDLRRAFEIGRQISPYVIIERELQGIVHRVTLIGQRMAAVVMRDYPNVVGDGTATLRELVAAENTDPRRDDFAFYKIQPNERADAQLKAQALRWDSIPEKGRRVVLNDKVSRLHGTVTVDVTERVHPDNVALFDRIGEVMGDPLIGVDFMIGDMSQPWHEQPGAGVIECNAMPYIDLHHYPYEGKVRPVAQDLWEYVFANSV